MGSEKYPDENAFDKFASSHGGYTNAHTDAEATVFSFDIKPRFLRAALDIFANFFIAPLLKADWYDQPQQHQSAYAEHCAHTKVSLLLPPFFFGCPALCITSV